MDSGEHRSAATDTPSGGLYLVNWLRCIAGMTDWDESMTLAQAVEDLRRGLAIGLPTDTQYALAADAANPAAVSRVYDHKRRPRTEPCPVFLPGIDWLFRVALVEDDRVVELARCVWPGAVTLIFPLNPQFETTAAADTIGLRIPDHPIARAVLEEFGGPLTGTSANRSGQPAALTADEVSRQLGGDLPVLGEGGKMPAGLPSTMLDCTGPKPRVLRRGAQWPPDAGDFLFEAWGLTEAALASDD